MSEFSITMCRSSDLSDEECKARIDRAYGFILALKDKDRVDQDKAPCQDPESAQEGSACPN